MSANKVVLITGSSEGGIGFHLATEFAKAGCTVFATARTVDKMKGLEESIHKLPLDVRSDDQVDEAVRQALSIAGKIIFSSTMRDVTPLALPILDATIREVNDVFDTNLFGVIRLVKAVVPHMVQRRSGLVINVSSIAAIGPMPWSGLYSSSKAAIFALSDVLDMEMRPFGVRLLLLCPGAVQSRLADNHGLDVSTLLPSGSLYTSFIACISRRLRITQINALSTERFAQQTVSAALQPTAPRYMSIGAHVWVAWALTWVPRSLRLKLYWDDYQKT